MEYMKDEAIRIVKLAGSKIKALRERKQFKESTKEGCELVTTADIISNNIIKSEIYKNFPNHKILSEEDYEDLNLLTEDPTWIIDPIDGTVGYANDHYQVAISIAFVLQNKAKVGVVYNPFLNELFYAIEGKGAYLNDKPISVKEVDNLKECVIGTGFPHKTDNIQNIMKTLSNVLLNVRDIRRLGSPALDICWVACGRMQGFYEGKLYPWDVAAAKLIALEAGAKIGYYHDKDITIPDCINGNNLMISSPGIFNGFKKVLSNTICS